jgi:hypothetical protein
MSLLQKIINDNRAIYFSFNGSDYSDKIKLRLEIKKKKIAISYLTGGMNHLKIKPRIIHSNTKKYKIILNNIGFDSNDDFIIIDCNIENNSNKFMGCLSNYKIKKIFILEKSGYYKLYEYLKIRTGIFSYNYINQKIYNEY